MTPLTTRLESLRRWWKRRQMWSRRTCWTWPREPKAQPDPRDWLREFHRSIKP